MVNSSSGNNSTIRILSLNIRKYNIISRGEIMDYIELIKEIMINKNINQKQLGLTLGLSQSQVSELLNEKYKPSYDTIFIICSKLSIPPNVFFNLENFDDNIKTYNIFAKDENTLLKEYRKLDRTMKNVAKQYIESLIEIQNNKK